MKELQSLCELVVNGKPTGEQYDRFLALMADPANEQTAKEIISAITDGSGHGDESLPVLSEERLLMLKSSILKTGNMSEEPAVLVSPAQVPVHRIHFLRTAWFRYAAAVILLCGTGTFLYLNTRTKAIAPVSTVVQVADIAPGGNKAILTLADGTRMILDSSANGALASQGGTRILKLTEGSLAYQEGNGGSGELLYNTISTPRGGQYQVVLPDGTRVWLNAASSVRFPVSFSTVRTIELTGEAYLEVAKHKDAPFIVMANGAKIEVLGTSFNVTAYPEENNITTSLVEGAVKVSKGTNSLLLRPGTQAVVKDNEGIALLPEMNTDDVLAWKNGWFSFKGLALEEAMRQVARWYDVEVVYAGNISKQEKIVAGMQRNLPLAKLIRKLEMTGEMHFVMEGRKLTISR